MIKFQAVPFKSGPYVVVKLPADQSASLPSRGMVMVKGTVDGRPFQMPLEPDGRGSHWFKLDGSRSGTPAGTVEVSLEPTKEWPEPDVPADVRKALDADAEALAFWNDVTPMARWDWLRWIGSTKNPATRERHVRVALSKLKKGERRPCCFNRAACTDPYVSKNAMLMEPA